MFEFSEDKLIIGDNKAHFYIDSKEAALGCFGYINYDIKELQESFIRLGFHLHEFLHSPRMIASIGYATGYDALEVNFGLSRSTVSRLVDVFLRFSACENGSHKMYIDDKYADYNYSQLCELLPLKDSDLKRFNARMTVKEMRELKKEIKNQYTSNRSELENKDNTDLLSPKSVNVLHPDSSVSVKVSSEQKICDVAKNNDVYDFDSYVLRSSVTAEIERLKKEMLAGDEDGQYFSGYVDALNQIKKFVNLVSSKRINQ